MHTLYHSDPTTGEVYETKTVETDAEKKHAMTADGGLWFETPRWHTNPKPHGFDPSNPYERPVVTPYAEFPRVLHKKIGVDPTTKSAIWQTLTIKAGPEALNQKRAALKGNYLLVPDATQHAELAKTDPEAQAALESQTVKA